MQVVGEVLPLLLPPWELRVCVVPTAHNAFAIGCLVWATLLFTERAGGQRGLAVATPALGAPRARHCMSAVNDAIVFGHNFGC